MNIYFSGLGGVGIGPLAQIARDAGHTVSGSDMSERPLTQQLRDEGVAVNIGQDGQFLRACHEAAPIDWFVYTSALPSDHPELVLASQLGIRTGKRDEFLAELIALHNLKLIAVAGTHGKTTTTGMMVWALKQLGVPVSYSVGSTLSFGRSGHYEPGSEYFVYECDEFDRNFLHFQPYLSLITSIDYDHPDTYPTQADYKAAFRQYIDQSERTILWQTEYAYVEAAVSPRITVLAPDDVRPFTLAGAHNRRNATLVAIALEQLQLGTPETRQQALDTFPGTDRRFEKLANNLYSDYGHHPAEIAATLQLASELSPHVTLVYQPHQNVRQHEIRELYTDDVFTGAEEVLWLPTYLSRENAELEILTPEQLTASLLHTKYATFSDLDDALWNAIQQRRAQGSLVLLMGAGSIDEWAREQLRRELQ